MWTLGQGKCNMCCQGAGALLSGAETEAQGTQPVPAGQEGSRKPQSVCRSAGPIPFRLGKLLVDEAVSMCRVAQNLRSLVNSTPRCSHDLAIGPTLRPSYHLFHKSPGMLFMNELAQ